MSIMRTPPSKLSQIRQQQAQDSKGVRTRTPASQALAEKMVKQQRLSSPKRTPGGGMISRNKPAGAPPRTTPRYPNGSWTRVK